MTSMPASRRARLMTLTPRSWPSSPTLAVRIRILRVAISDMAGISLAGWGGVVDRRPAIAAKDLAHGLHDLALGGVGFDRRQDGFDQVGLGAGRDIEIVEGGAHGAAVATALDPGQALLLRLLHLLGDLED